MTPVHATRKVLVMSNALRRGLPLGAAILGLAALPGSALAAPGVVAPGGEVVYNTASITLSNYPAGAVPITVTRDGTTIATGTANVDGTGVANVNVAGIVAPEPLDCWTGFTPDILPGDIVNIGASAVPVGGAGVGATALTMPNFSISRPAQVGSELVAHGTAVDALGNPVTGVQGMIISKLPRFSTGTKGGSIISGALGFDNLATGAFTTRFAGLTAGDMALGLSSAVAEIATVPAGGPGAPAAVGPVFTLGADNPAVPGPVAGCTAPLGADSVTGANTKTINAANQNQALTITGTSDPNVKGVTLTLGGSTVPAALAGGTWSATVNPANLPDGTLTAAATYTNATGSYHGRTMSLVKDTAAPSAPTADVASGAYPSARNVGLSAESGATIHYTTNGSDPTTSSKTYNAAINVTQTGPVKAIAVDNAGNVSDISRFDYVINPPATVVAPITAAAPLPKLKVDSIDMARSFHLRTARKRGLQLTVFAPEGAKVVRLRLVRGTKTIDTVTRKLGADGVIEVNLPHTRKLRRALKRGTYQVLVAPGRSATSLGITTVRTIKVR
jgi:hypothetical protein